MPRAVTARVKFLSGRIQGPNIVNIHTRAYWWTLSRALLENVFLKPAIFGERDKLIVLGHGAAKRCLMEGKREGSKWVRCSGGGGGGGDDGGDGEKTCNRDDICPARISGGALFYLLGQINNIDPAHKGERAAFILTPVFSSSGKRRWKGTRRIYSAGSRDFVTVPSPSPFSQGFIIILFQRNKNSHVFSPHALYIGGEGYVRDLD